MNLHATQPHESQLDDGPTALASPPPGGRFSYATGARPLSGYTIKRGIGHGGFGEVYYATSDAGKEVALKLIRRNWDVELRGVTQCLNLKHPNLLSLYDVRQDAQGDNWVVMELMSGESLEDVVARHPNGLPEAEALVWIHGIAAGVAYLHDHGIVHRDLKPGNIFVDEGIIKIGDYGLSKFISCSRRSGQTGSVGTVHYMAPEIANGRYGKEIDIYALGVILYEMLTGHVPFEGESVGEILMKHLTAEPDTSRLDEPFRTIVSRCLAKDPARRFNSVSELIALLPAVPAGTATAAARFAGPNSAVLQRSAEAGPAPHSTGYSLAPEIGATLEQRRVDGASAVPQAVVSHQEPILGWMLETRSDLQAWWTTRNFRAWQKLLIVGVTVCLAVLTVPVWLSAAAIGIVLYLAYWVIWSLAQPTIIPAGAAAIVQQEGKRRRRRWMVVMFGLGALGTLVLQAADLGGFDRVFRRDDWLAMFPVGGIFAAVGLLVARFKERRFYQHLATAGNRHEI